MSTRNPTHGTKVNDPNAPSIHEGTGAIASDSMAADSVRDGGKFGENCNSEPLGVKGANSTFANKNTSGAIQLDPATDAGSRPDQEGTSYPDSVGGQAKNLAVEKTTGSSATGGDTSSAGVAPSYVNSQFVDEGKPKGKNLTEGGFESDDKKNASWTADIGSKDDPAREAILKIQRENADAAGDAAMPRGKHTGNDNEYETLDTDAPA